MAVVDEGRDRHQLDAIDAEEFEMVDDTPGGEPGDGAAQRTLHARMAHGVAAHIELVHQARRLAPRRLVLVDLRRQHHGLGHQRRGVDGILARQPQPRRAHEHPVDAARIGIDQELVGIEMQALIGIVGTIGPKAVFHPRTDAGDQPVMDVVVMPVELEALDLAVGLVVERHVERRRRLGIDGEVDAFGGDGGAELFGAATMGDQLRFHDSGDLGRFR
ncbi:MAG: hypothetical protein ABT13_01595 [Pelagibacterium sp. SCN 68-10]|nr:MAG: hypothetical protein ABT13_01595 [Pelagibacterium sp. SCN 68-10]